MAAGRRRDRTERQAGAGGWSPATLLGIVLLLAAISGGAYAWKIWGATIVDKADRPLTLEQLQITPQPTWIRARIREEAFRDGSLGQLTLLDKQASYKIYRAFEMHPWVAHVDRVNKSPDGRVFVDLRFRRPVAWVEIPSGMSSLDEPGVLPIDENAVLLPPEDLQGRIGDFIRISIPDLPPWGLKGTPWGDARLVGAARLALLLEGCWRSLSLYRIRAIPFYEAGNASELLYELVTASGQRILWGSAPGVEKSGEASPQQKLIRLKQIASEGLSDSPEILDLRIAFQNARRN